MQIEGSMNKAGAISIIALICSSLNCPPVNSSDTKESSGEKPPLPEQRRQASNSKDLLVSGHFSKSAWKAGLAEKWTRQGWNYVDRSDEFRRFLQDYNLIGMTPEEVTRVLGTPDKHEPLKSLEHYTISSGLSGSDALLEIAYENGKVHKWRLYSLDHSGPWIDTDSLWLGHTPMMSADGKLQSYVEKSTTATQE